MVFALGAQYQPISKLFFRAGYNYGKTPVDDNDGFDGTAPKSVHFFVDITCHIVAFWVEWYIVVFNACPSQQIIIPFFYRQTEHNLFSETERYPKAV
jgi:hypothetical protein